MRWHHNLEWVTSWTFSSILEFVAPWRIDIHVDRFTSLMHDIGFQEVFLA